MHHAYGQFLLSFEQKHRTLIHKNSSNNQKAAVIVETRENFWLPKVLQNFAFFLGSSWNFYVIGSNLNESYVKKNFEHWELSFYSVKFQGQFTKETYNWLLKRKGFWELFTETKILIFQTDTIACQPLDDEFLDFDFIGAPCGEGFAYFNGGLSLRTRETMIEAIDCYENNTDLAEDLWFTEALRFLGKKLPDYETACKFSVESHYFGLPFGVHGTDKPHALPGTAAAIINEIQY